MTEVTAFDTGFKRELRLTAEAFICENSEQERISKYFHTRRIRRVRLRFAPWILPKHSRKRKTCVRIEIR